MTQALQQSPETREIYKGHRYQEVELLVPVAPEDEVYGRSLSAVRRLGVAVHENPHRDLTSCPEAEQAKIEFYTSVEEGLGTDKEFGSTMEVNSAMSFDVKNGRVLSLDKKTSVIQMMNNAVICGKKRLLLDKNFEAQYTRTLYDKKNALEVDAMVRGERSYNTRIVVSPYPEEAAAVTGHDYWGKIGYVPSLKRGFVQMYHVGDDGEFIAGSYSFEGSQKNHLHEVFKALGIKVPENASTDEWLQFALTDNFNAEQAEQLAQGVADMCNQKINQDSNAKVKDTVDMSGRHKTLIDRIFYENYVAIALPTVIGSQTKELRKVIQAYHANSTHFNKNYQRALDEMMNKHSFNDNDAAVMHELLVYSTIEMLRAMELDQTADTKKMMHNMKPEQLAEISRLQLQSMLGGFGGHGAKNNRVYMACGNGIAPGINENFGLAEDENPQEIFGGKKRGRRDRFGSLVFTCPNGHENEREPGNLMPECKVCGTDVSCGMADGHGKKGGESGKMAVSELIENIININRSRSDKADLSPFVSRN